MDGLPVLERDRGESVANLDLEIWGSTEVGPEQPRRGEKKLGGGERKRGEG